MDIARKTVKFPESIYVVALIALSYFGNIMEQQKDDSRIRLKHPFRTYFSAMALPFVGLLVSLLIQMVFISFLYLHSGPFCVCLNHDLISPMLAFVAVFLFLMSVYLDILETYQLIDFQLLRITKPETDIWWNKAWSCCILVIIYGILAIKLLIAIAMVVIATPFLFSSGTTGDLILNAVSLLFILEVDELLYRYSVRPNSNLEDFINNTFAEGGFPIKSTDPRLTTNSIWSTTSTCLRFLGYGAFLVFSSVAVGKQCDLVFFDFDGIDNPLSDPEQRPSCLREL